MNDISAMQYIDTKTTEEKYYTCFCSHVLSDLMSKSVVSNPEGKNVPEPTKEIVLEPTKEIVLEPTKEIVLESTMEPTKEVVLEPAKEIVLESAKEVVPEPTKEFVLEPTKKSVWECAREPTKKSVWENAREPKVAYVLRNPKNTRNFDKLKGITERRMCWNVKNCGKYNTNPIPGEDWCYECAFLAKKSVMFFPPGTCDYCRVKLTQTNVQFPPYCTSVKPTCFFRQKFLLDHVDSRFQTNMACSYQNTLPCPCPYQ